MTAVTEQSNQSVGNQPLLTKQDNDQQAGSLETFVAMCLLMNPANPLVASWLPAGINLQPMRALIEGKPHTIWSFSGDNGESKETLEILGSVAQAIVNIPETYSETEFEQVKKICVQ